MLRYFNSLNNQKSYKRDSIIFLYGLLWFMIFYSSFNNTQYVGVILCIEIVSDIVEIGNFGFLNRFQRYDLVRILSYLDI